MSRLWNITGVIAARSAGLLEAERASVLALLWVMSNVALGWMGVAIGHPNLGALAAGALDGTVFSAIVLVRASPRLEAGMTGLLSGVGMDSITNGGRMVANSVHGVHELLEQIVNASAEEMPAGHHQELELMIMRAVWTAIIVTLLALFIKWGQTKSAAAVSAPLPTLIPAPAPAEMARSQAA
jgi:hypothetical protein